MRRRGGLKVEEASLTRHLCSLVSRHPVEVHGLEVDTLLFVASCKQELSGRPVPICGRHFFQGGANCLYQRGLKVGLPMAGEGRQISLCHTRPSE